MPSMSRPVLSPFPAAHHPGPTTSAQLASATHPTLLSSPRPARAGPAHALTQRTQATCAPHPASLVPPASAHARRRASLCLCQPEPSSQPRLPPPPPPRSCNRPYLTPVIPGELSILGTHA
jgi:hypothetical protein